MTCSGKRKIFSDLILNACLSRKADREPLFFKRSDSRKEAEEAENCYLVLRKEDGTVKERRVPLQFYGDLTENYDKHKEGGGLNE